MSGTWCDLRSADDRRAGVRALNAVCAIALTIAVLGLLGGCRSALDDGDAGTGAGATADTAPTPTFEPGEVVIYTSVDQNFAEPVLKAFEAETGIAVKPVFDVEAAKTTGLVNRLIAEREHPQADVWWNGEFSQTIALAEDGILAAYDSPAAADIPPAYRDPGGLWTGFGGRARVLLVNTDLVAEADTPQGIDAFLSATVAPDQTAIALPMFGTTATHAAALYALWGKDKGLAFFQQIADRGVRVVDGNGVVRDLVADGQVAFGLTDTDDACGAVARGAPVKIVFPDQAGDAMGTLLIPNTVGLVAGGPNTENGKQLIDYLLRPSTEADMVKADWIQIALRPLPPDVASTVCINVADVHGMAVSLTDVAAQIEAAKTDLTAVFVR